MVGRFGIRTQYIALSIALLSALARLAFATDYTVTNSATFYSAIEAIDAAPTSSDRIILGNNFTMGQQVLAITTTGSLTVDGHGFTIDGGNQYRPFFVSSGNVTLENLTITNASAHGGNGGDGWNGGGGAAGGGGALFVNTGANVMIS